MNNEIYGKKCPKCKNNTILIQKSFDVNDSTLIVYTSKCNSCDYIESLKLPAKWNKS